MSNYFEYPISNMECPMPKWNALLNFLSQRRRGAKGIALFLTGFKKLSQRRKDAKVKVKADDNLFLTGLGIEAEHFSTLQLCNPVNPVNPVQNKAMPFAPLRLCEKLLNPVNPVHYVKPHPD